MTAVDATDERKPDAAEPTPLRGDDHIRQRRSRNLALLAALAAFAVLIYVLSLVKLGAG